MCLLVKCMLLRLLINMYVFCDWSFVALSSMNTT